MSKEHKKKPLQRICSKCNATMDMNNKGVWVCPNQNIVSKEPTCEWCGLNYPVDTKGNLAYDFWQIKVFKKEHIICDDCYKHLKLITKVHVNVRKSQRGVRVR